MNNLVLEYNKYKNLVKNADVLLFHATKFPQMGWWISKYTNSPYSHAALAYWDDGELYCLEFREFKGARQYPLRLYLEKGNKVDVFRTMKDFNHPTIEYSHNKDYYEAYDEHKFTDDISKKIVNTAKTLIGVEYDWWTIFKMGKTYVPFLRFKTNHKNDDDFHDSHSFVCSTLVTYCYRKHFIDPVPFLADRYTSPGDLARSGLFFKLFQIK